MTPRSKHNSHCLPGQGHFLKTHARRPLPPKPKGGGGRRDGEEKVGRVVAGDRLGSKLACERMLSLVHRAGNGPATKD